MQSDEDALPNYSFVDKTKLDWTAYPFAALPSRLGVSAVKRRREA
jgi:hypothetical protein